MGAQWKHAGRVAQSAAKGALFTKLSKELIVSARLGGPDPEHNARLRAAIEAARKASMTRDTMERAIKKGAGLTDGDVVYETVVYEGFAPHQVAVIVECLTDNKNRTAADVRVIFRKGQLGGAGSVAWKFDRKGVIEANPRPGVDPEEAAIEAGAQEVEVSEDTVRFVTEIADLGAVNEALTKAGWVISSSELQYIAKSPIELDDAKKAEVITFLQALEDNDDVHRVYAELP